MYVRGGGGGEGGREKGVGLRDRGWFKREREREGREIKRDRERQVKRGERE